MGNIAQGRWLRSQYSRVLHLPRDRAGMQFFPVVHKYFNWFIVKYKEHYFWYYILHYVH